MYFHHLFSNFQAFPYGSPYSIKCSVMCVRVSVYLGVMEMFFVGLLLTISDSEWECGGDMTSVGVWGRHD